jgi:hypothetical protein
VVPARRSQQQRDQNLHAALLLGGGELEPDGPVGDVPRAVAVEAVEGVEAVGNGDKVGDVGDGHGPRVRGAAGHAVQDAQEVGQQRAHVLDVPDAADVLDVDLRERRGGLPPVVGAALPLAARPCVCLAPAEGRGLGHPAAFGELARVEQGTKVPRGGAQARGTHLEHGREAVVGRVGDVQQHVAGLVDDLRVGVGLLVLQRRVERVHALSLARPGLVRSGPAFRSAFHCVSPRMYVPRMYLYSVGDRRYV